MEASPLTVEWLWQCYALAATLAVLIAVTIIIVLLIILIDNIRRNA